MASGPSAHSDGLVRIAEIEAMIPRLAGQLGVVILMATGTPSLASDVITPRLLDAAANGVLIHGRVRDVLNDQAADGRVPVRVVVEHVYWGATLDLNAVVTDYSKDEGSIRYEALIPFRPGEEGLWLLMPTSDGILEVVYRIRKQHDARFEQVVAQARFLDAVRTAASDGRYALAVRNVTNATPEVAMSAVHVAVAADPRRARGDVLNFVVKPGIQVGAQIEFDRALSNRLGAEWRSSESRTKLIAAWPDLARDEDTLRLVLSDLSIRLQGKEPDIPPALAAASIASIATDEKKPKPSRLLAVRQLATAATRADLGPVVFDGLTGVLQGSRDAGLRRAAAAYLRGLVCIEPNMGRKPLLLSPAQIDRLAALHRGEADDVVEAALFETYETATEAALRLRGAP